MVSTGLAATARASSERDDAAALAVDDLEVVIAATGRRVHAVQGVSFAVAPGGTRILLGESGCGKSATLRAVMRLFGRDTVIRGRVRLDGHDLLTLPDRDMRSVRGRDVALVPQDPNAALDPLRRVGGQLAEQLRAHQPDMGRRQASRRAEELLHMVRLPDPRSAARAFPHELSGGMRQRVAIALAVSCSPKVLLADEPTTALDVTVQAQILELLAGLQQTMQMALLLVTHDVGVVRELGGSISVMYAGRVVEDGAVADVLDRPAHPYLAGLLASQPGPGVARGGLIPIAGQPPSLEESALVRGCAFHERCASAREQCTRAQPPLVAVRPGHDAACPVWNPPQGGEAVQP
ncbi:MAG TPA: ABC transporter ATP-binding protein [Candidatus Dormibacteraeota bacterium]|jgi:oligopeptide/dipeptide ABC transporter ATP-binding protein|nr:ABC transporter ATP-binding protein [Candidatus Dormibacteraeota bacterium]